LHGEAVAAGMVMAADLVAAQQSGFFRRRIPPASVPLLERAGLPTAAKGITPGALQELMRCRQKARSGRIHFVLLSAWAQLCFAPTYRLPQSTPTLSRLAA